MSRLTLGNVVKVGLVVAFLPLLAYLVLVIGGVKKHLRTVLEGLFYAAGFSVGIFALDVIGPGGLLALASMGASGVRAYHLRDLWLPARRRWWHRFTQPATTDEPAPEPAAAIEPPSDLAAAVTQVRTQTVRHRHRLPAGAYGQLAKIWGLLDAVVAAEQREPIGDVRADYELDALVKQYLPAVLRSYLAIPPTMVDVKQPNGRTPNEELSEQLELLAGQAEALHAVRSSRTSAQLTTTGNFLREKFGHRQAFDFG